MKTIFLHPLAISLALSIGNANEALAQTITKNPATKVKPVNYSGEQVLGMLNTRQIPFLKETFNKKTNNVSNLSVQRTAAIGNLISNSDFELQTVTPPSGNNSNVLIRGGIAAHGGEVANWECATSGTVDYFATNAPTTIPPYYQPYQTTNPSSAFTGSPFTPYNYNSSLNNGCLGMITYIPPGAAGADSYAEYAFQTLVSPLKDKDYYATMQAYSASTVRYSTRIGMDISVNDPRDYSISSNPSNNNNVYPLLNHTGCGFDGQIISKSAWTTVSKAFHGTAGATYLTIGNFSRGAADIDDTRPTPDANNPFGYQGPNAYQYVDQIELYEIPTAGTTQAVSCNSNTIIGDGYPIPGATYAWTVQGSSAAPFSKSLQTPVPKQAVNTTYVLTVTLPNGAGTFVSTVTVTGANSAPIDQPQVIQEDPENWRNKNQAKFTIANRIPGADYKITNVQYANPTAQPGKTSSSFIVKGGYGNPGPVYYGYFTITVTNDCGSLTSDQIQVEYRIGTTPGARTLPDMPVIKPLINPFAFPNPAREHITLPDQISDAVLLDANGRVVREGNAGGLLDLGSLPTGFYTLRFKRDGQVENQRIQVTH